LVKVEFQRTMPSALVNSSQTVSGGAWIRAETAHRSRKGERVCTAVIALLDMTAEDIPSPGHRPRSRQRQLGLGVVGIAILLGAELNAELDRSRAIAAGHPPDEEPYMELVTPERSGNVTACSAQPHPQAPRTP
jgi:hypothetical protein